MTTSQHEARRHHHTSPAERAVIYGLAALSAILAAFSANSPTGLEAIDVVLCAGLGAVVVMAASRSRRWSWLVTAAFAMAFSSGWLLIPAIASMAAAFVAGLMKRRSRVLGAAIGAACVQVLLRLPSDGPLSFLDFHGGTALLAALGLAPVLVSGYKHAKPPAKRAARYAALFAALLVVVSAAVFGASTLSARNRVESAITKSRQALKAAREGHVEESRRLLDTAESEFADAHKMVAAWWVAPARVVPVLSYQAKALDEVTSEGAMLAKTARNTVQQGDYHDLRYESGAFNLDLVRRIRGPLKESNAALDHAQRTVSDIDSPWIVAPLRTKIDEYEKDLVEAAHEADLADQAANVVPGLLGGDGPRHYLVLFTTPSEQRGMGGFIGDYAELEAVNGKVRMSRHGAIDELLYAVPAGQRQLLGPADYIARYGQYKITDYLQDLTLSPDFPSVASVASQLYPQSGGRPVDGVILVDPYGLQALLNFTGPVKVDGLDVPLTKDNAAQILLKDQYLKFGRDDVRSDFLREATRATFDKLTNGSLPAPASIARIMSPQVRGGHFLMWSPKPDEEQFFESLHAGGALPKPDGGDLMSLRVQNSGHNKIDIYQHRDITYKASYDPATGKVDAIATITFTNDSPTSGLPNYVIGNTAGLPIGSNRMNVSLYSPLAVQSATLDGKAVALSDERELGWKVHSTPLTVAGGQKRTLIVHLQGKIDPGAYHLTLAPQPAVNPETVDVSVNAGSAGRIKKAAGAVTEVQTLDPQV